MGLPDGLTHLRDHLLLLFEHPLAVSGPLGLDGMLSTRNVSLEVCLAEPLDCNETDQAAEPFSLCNGWEKSEGPCSDVLRPHWEELQACPWHLLCRLDDVRMFVGPLLEPRFMIVPGPCFNALCLGELLVGLRLLEFYQIELGVVVEVL